MQMLSVKELVAGSILVCVVWRGALIGQTHLASGSFRSNPGTHPQVTSGHTYHQRNNIISWHTVYNLHKSSSSIIHHQHKFIYNLPPRFRFIKTEIKVSQSFTSSTHSHRVPPSPRNRDSRRSITCPSR
jgi:hypothetical protein